MSIRIFRATSRGFAAAVVAISVHFALPCSSAWAVGASNNAPVIVGARVVLDELLDELEGKRVGLAANSASRVGERHTLDAFLANGIDVQALFALEHGFYADREAGEGLADAVHEPTGLVTYSLYGKNKAPTDRMLAQLDLVLFDVQDVGARFYTYISTLGKIIESAARRRIPVWVLDRPNPSGGTRISGWRLEDRHKSFVGQYPVPMAYAMTVGELAWMMVGEHWVKGAEAADVRVVGMKGWKRSMLWPDTGLEWFPTSPNLPTFHHAYVYPGTALFEGTTISEGRGTADPFLTVGSPATRITTTRLRELRRKFPGVRLERHSFVPESMPGKSAHPKFEGERCHGIQVKVLDPGAFDPVELGAELLAAILDATPGSGLTDYVENLAGIDQQDLLRQLKDGSYRRAWKAAATAFSTEREPYLLYE